MFKDCWNTLRTLFALVVWHASRHPNHWLRCFARYVLQDWLAPLIERAGRTIEGFACDNIAEINDRYHRMQPPLLAHERFGYEERPEGWNDGVLHYFHALPGRPAVTDDFSEAFQRRAKVPPPSAFPLDHRSLWPQHWRR